MRTSAIYSAKNFKFFEIYGVSARAREEECEPVRTLCGQERERSQFRTSFMNGPLQDIFDFEFVLYTKTVNFQA